MTQYYIQQVEMTDDEKFDMYMKVPHDELVRMKIESEKYIKMLEQCKCCKQHCDDRTIFYEVDPDVNLAAVSVNKVRPYIIKDDSISIENPKIKVKINNKSPRVKIGGIHGKRLKK